MAAETFRRVTAAGAVLLPMPKMAARGLPQ